MPREKTTNRFSGAGQALVSSKTAVDKTPEPEVVNNPPKRKKDKVITAKVYQDTWDTFTAINTAQGMTNNSVINMLISEYVRNKKVILEN